jgi:hypothetical protein
MSYHDAILNFEDNLKVYLDPRKDPVLYNLTRGLWNLTRQIESDRQDLEKRLRQIEEHLRQMQLVQRT